MFIDSLPSLVRELYDVPLAVLSLRDQPPRWSAATNLEAALGPETVADLCSFVNGQGTVPCFFNTRRHPNLAAHPLVAGPPGLRYLAGIVLRTRRGTRLGSLSLADTRGRRIHPERLAHLKTLAHAAVTELNGAAIEKEGSAAPGFRYRSLIEHAAEGIFVSLINGRFVEVNARACVMTGFARKQLLRMRPEDIITAHSFEERPPVWSHLQVGRPLQLEREIRRADGTTFPAEVSLMRINDDLVEAIVRDLTERKQYESELIAAKERAEELHRLKSTLLANLSHEIRSPLTSIIGFTEVLAEQLPETGRDLTDPIRRSGERLLATLNSVLSIAQLESGALTLRPHPLDVAELARQVLDLFRPQARERGLQLTLKAERAVFGHVDEGVLIRVLTNLISNAVKFTCDGEITVSVEDRGHDVAVQVHDTGVGMDASFLPHAFEEFRQEMSGYPRDNEGSGLGLAITRRLVDLMRGRISLESEKGVGTTATVTFPASPRPESRHPGEGQESGHP